MMNKYTKCLRCGRKLKTEEAKERGFGQICWEKYRSDVKYKELFSLDNKKST